MLRWLIGHPASLQPLAADTAAQVIVAKREGGFNGGVEGKPRPFNGFGPKTAAGQESAGPQQPKTTASPLC
jgi:hypothetical protein